WIFERSVPGLPAAAAAEGLTPLQYMRKYGCFEVVRDNYVPYEKTVDAAEAEVDPQGRVHRDGAVVGVLVDGQARVGFETPSRKLELYSSTLAEWGWNERDYVIPWPLPSHVIPAE